MITTRKIVADNIKAAVKEGNFNLKMEVGDPKVSPDKKRRLVEKNVSFRQSNSYKIKNGIARGIADIATKIINVKTEIIGIENLEEIKSGAIITSNHFNPVDSTIIRKMTQKQKKRLYIVSQDTNLAMNGPVGFLMKYADTIPISEDRKYLNGCFKEMAFLASKEDYLLIYPEQEMWFNYRKPRPLKRGAYYYAAKFNRPVISCFVEIRDHYILYILPTIYPDPQKGVRENSIIMCQTDYQQKKEAYERAYGKELVYEFEDGDIAE
ncbi:MAG: 1-acyl-sn-glycerol-3-phosphate acyltransferase [Firmicutes bacterium]|nr:1-acyl-sn-glycerol-3-phosphate acyltransferase [Bacillota bacterium]